MKRSLVPLILLLGSLAVVPSIASAASTCAPGQTPGVPPLYCIPPAPPATPNDAARGTANAAGRDLSALTPSALAGKGGIALTASASGAGTMTIVLKAKVRGKVVVIGSAKKTFGSAGAATIELVLTKAGKALLMRHKGSLKVTVSATFKATHGKAATAKIGTTLK